MAYFALTMVHGPNWDASRQIREQQAWDQHAAFMDGLVDDGFVVIGGPLGDGEQVLLLVESTSEHAVRALMRADPWATMGLLQVAAVKPWAIWLDSRDNGQAT